MTSEKQQRAGEPHCREKSLAKNANCYQIVCMLLPCLELNLISQPSRQIKTEVESREASNKFPDDIDAV